MYRSTDLILKTCKKIIHFVTQFLLMFLNEERVAILTFLPGPVHGGQRRQISLPQSQENQGKGVTYSYIQKIWVLKGTGHEIEFKYFDKMDTSTSK